jgi:hypothetical protein
MKSAKPLLCILAIGAMIFAAINASAVPFGILNVRGTVLTETNYSPAPGVNVGKIIKQRFGTKDILSLLADATGIDWFTNKGSVLFYDGYTYNDAATSWYSDYPYEVYGIFYVTNTISHNSYRLDGLDAETNYYSYVEFDCRLWHQGFWRDPGLGENSVQKCKYNFNADEYAGKILQQGLLYIHSNPYAFDIMDNSGSVSTNDNALVIRGLGVFDWTFRGMHTTQPTGAIEVELNGIGDGYFSAMDTPETIVQGKMTFKNKKTTLE